MIYANYEYYQAQYIGSAISEDDYPHLAKKASAYLDYYTMGRARAAWDTEAVKMACCALAEQYQAIEAAATAARNATATAGDKKSETVGSYSVSYVSGDEVAKTAQTAAESAKATLADTVRQYLAPTGLLYRGGGCGVHTPHRNSL